MKAVEIPDSVDLDREFVEQYGFMAFVIRAWRHADPSEIQWSWHMLEVCEELEALARDRKQGVGRDLAIAIPPSSSKSMIVSVLWQAWVWTWWPESRWITSAYDAPLARKLCVKSRDLIMSQWYQDRWPLEMTKTLDSHIRNENGGERRAVGIGSRITGEHGHFLLLDDPVKEQLTRLGSPTQIADAVSKAVTYWFGTLSTRRIDYVAARVVVHQRLHVDDPIGIAERDHGYDVIRFPARYNPATADKRDHRDVEGELLCPRITEEALANIEYEIGPTAARAQLDQDPAPLGGAIIHAEWTERRWRLLPAELLQDLSRGYAGPGRRWIISGDCTFKGKPTSDFVVFQVWCSWEGKRFLIYQIRGRWGFGESKAQLKAFKEQWSLASPTLLEDAANAAATEDDLRDLPDIVLAPVAGGVLARTQAIESDWKYLVVLPAKDASIDRDIVQTDLDFSWVDSVGGFVAEHIRYNGDGTGHDDTVSASSLALLHLKSRSGLPSWARGAAAAMQQGIR